MLEFLHTHRTNVARTLLALKRPANVLAFAAEGEEPPATTVNRHLIRADFLCSCVRACGADAVDGQGEGPGERAEGFGRRAVASLETAVDAGFGDLTRLQTPGLSVLRGRADYRAPLARVKAQSQSQPGR